MEPLVKALYESAPQAGVTVKQVYSFVSVYADDVLIYLSDAGKDMAEIMSCMTKHGEMSGYSINWKKSVHFKCRSDTEGTEEIESLIPTQETFRYLGVIVAKSQAEWYALNYIPLLKYLEEKVRQWKHLPISLAGRAAVLKMTVLPKFLYVFVNVPVVPPASFFKTCNTKMNEFLWAGKVPRIALKTLTRAYSDGGLEVPDMEGYFQASQLQHMIRWGEPIPRDPYVQMEQRWFRGNTAQNLVVTPAPCPLADAGPPRVSLMVWRRVVARSKTPHPYSPYIMLSDLDRSFTTTEFAGWAENGILTIEDLYHDGKLRDEKDILADAGGGTADLLRWLKVKAALRRKWQSYTIEPQEMPLLTHILTTATESHQVSRLYRLLRTQGAGEPIAAKRKWEREPEVEITDAVWDNACMKTQEISLSMRLRLIHYRFLTRSYITPETLSNIHGSEEVCCRGCAMPRASFLHMAWECPVLYPFWEAVTNEITNISGVKVPNTAAAVMLLDLVEVPNVKMKWVCLALTIAKQIIARNWMRGKEIQLKLWQIALAYCNEQEEVIRTIAHPSQAPKDIWLDYKNYLYDRGGGTDTESDEDHP